MLIPSPWYQLRMAPSCWNISLGELCASHRLMSVKVWLVNECGRVLLGVHLLGDWKEAKANRDLPTLLSWWEHHVNEKWRSRGRILPLYHLPCVCHLV